MAIIRMIASPLILVGQGGGDGVGEAGQRHGLQRDAPRTGDYGVKNALAAEEHVLRALYHLHVDGAGGFRHGKVAGIHNDLLAGLEIVLHGVTVDLDKSDAAAGELLHDEALAAEKAHHALALEEDGKLHALLRRQKGGLLADDGLIGGDLHGADGAGEAGGKGDQAGAAPGGIDVLENIFAGEHAAKGLAKAAGGGLHVHVGAHPDHGAAFGNHGFACVQLADDHGGRVTLNVVFHGCTVLSCDLINVLYRKSGGKGRGKKRDPF